MSKYILTIRTLLLACSIVLSDDKEQTEPVEIDPKVLANVYPKETLVALPSDAVARFGRGGGADVAISPDGSLVAIVSNIGVWLYSAYTDEFLSLLASEGGNVPSTGVFSPDGTQIAIGYRNGPAKLWNVFSQSTEAALPTFLHGGPATKVTFSPDGKLLATSGWDNIAILWDVATGENITTFEHLDAVRAIAFSPDGTLLATGAGRTVIRSTKTWQSISTLNTVNVTNLAFSPDGTRIAVGMSGRQPTVQIWDIAMGKPVATFTGHKRGIQSLAFSPDSRLLASGGSDGVIYLWEVTPDG